MTDATTLDLRDYRAWLLEQIEQELTAFDRRTSTMTPRERGDFDTFTDIELEDVERALESPQRPHPAGDALARTVLERQHLSLDALDDQERHAARIEALAAWADLLVLKAEAAEDTTRSFPTRARVFAQRREVLGRQAGDGSSVGLMSIEAIWPQQGLDVAAGKKRISQIFKEHHDGPGRPAHPGPELPHPRGGVPGS